MHLLERIAESLAQALERWGREVNSDDCDRFQSGTCADREPMPDHERCRICASRAALAAYQATKNQEKTE